jgi:phosphatidylinositol glycan class H protein
MRRSRPLTEAHPELLVIDIPGLSREYRVESWHPSRSQHRRLSGLPWVSVLDVFSVILVGFLWPAVRSFQNLLSSLGDSKHLLGEGECSPNDRNGNRARPHYIPEGYAGPLGWVRVVASRLLSLRLMRRPESVLVLPPYGIQLETHRGLPSLPFFVSRRFIPLTEVQDVLINEGLRRWDVRYYLAVLCSPRQGEQHLEVAYEVE